MVNTVHFAFLLLPFLCDIEFAHAQYIGTLEEAIEAGKKNEEPAYIKEIMQQLSIKLSEFAKSENIQSPRQKRAWLITMHGVISAIDEVATSCATRIFNTLFDQEMVKMSA